MRCSLVMACLTRLLPALAFSQTDDLRPVRITNPVNYTVRLYVLTPASLSGW